jgi:hypothetical protein
MDLIRQDPPTPDELYSYSIHITLQPGLNHISWCSSAPITFSSSTRYFPYLRPNLWILPVNPSTQIQYFTLSDSTSTMAPYTPAPYLFLSPYSFPSALHPLSLGIVRSGVPSLLPLSQLAAGAFGLFHPAVARIQPALSSVTFHPIHTSLFQLD